MKKIFTLALLAFAAASASAQYLCADKGTVLTYSKSFTDAEGKTETMESTSTVVEVNTAADGVVSVRYENVSPIPGRPLAKVTEFSESSYNPADSTTTIIVAGEEDSKASIVNMIRTEAEAAGQAVGEAQIAEIEKNINVKGELSMALKNNAPEGTKLPNKNLRLTMGPMTMSMNLWEGKVLGTESITTPAGTFECLKVSYLQKVKMAEHTERVYVTEWYAEGIGSVRTQNADKKGTVLATSELTAIARPE